MGKVILVCGKIGSGKTTYANALAEKYNAVIFAHDEIMLGLFGAELYENDKEQFFKYAPWVEEYVKRKSGESAKAGATAICANGFWSRAERDELRKFYTDMGISCELHYIDTPEEQRHKYIQKRNDEIRGGDLGYIFTDDSDINHYFEVPDEDEITVRVTFERKSS
ncbi:MAG: ATP-binding protein [Oscillospiraceae bacterium]|nr:ATP-binding protein [Oscillospiraceae bacterium]